MFFNIYIVSKIIQWLEFVQAFNKKYSSNIIEYYSCFYLLKQNALSLFLSLFLSLKNQNLSKLGNWSFGERNDRRSFRSSFVIRLTPWYVREVKFERLHSIASQGDPGTHTYTYRILFIKTRLSSLCSFSRIISSDPSDFSGKCDFSIKATLFKIGLKPKLRAHILI